jgi:hypothetical protein
MYKLVFIIDIHRKVYYLAWYDGLAEMRKIANDEYIIPELILKEHHNMVLLKYDEIDSIIVMNILESIGYNWRGEVQIKKC